MVGTEHAIRSLVGPLLIASFELFAGFQDDFGAATDDVIPDMCLAAPNVDREIPPHRE
jgi:hypothetical protein